MLPSVERLTPAWASHPILILPQPFHTVPRRRAAVSLPHRVRQQPPPSANQDPTSALVEVATNIHQTGVPILEDLLQLTVADATAKSLFLVGRAVVGVSLGSLALGALHARLSRTERQRVDFHPIRSPLVAAAKPALVLLPYYGVARIATVLSALVQVVAIRMRPEFDAFMRGHSEAALEVIQWVTQLLQDSCELFLILAVAWSLKRCKDRAVSALQLRVQQKADTAGGNDSLTRLLDGASGGVTWIIWIVAGFVALQAYGVDASPLLASLGASSIVLGLAAQKVLANVIAGLSLFASSAFAVGDHVKLVSSGGNVVVEGTIQVIAPARTVIRASDDGALIYVNNADITSMIVRNVSQAAVASAL